AQGSEWTARVVLNVHAAGLLIGRGGKRIKMLQEDSGAQMQFFQGTDAPKGFGEEDRLVELRGPPVELQDGLELLLSELARVPEALAPRCAQLLVPEDLKEECCEEALKFGASRANLGAALGDGERLLALEGDTAAVRGSAAVAVTAMLCRRLWKPGQPPPSYRRREAPRSDSEPRPALPSPLFASAEKAAQLLPWSLGKPSLGDPPHQKEDVWEKSGASPRTPWRAFESAACPPPLCCRGRLGDYRAPGSSCPCLQAEDRRRHLQNTFCPFPGACILNGQHRIPRPSAAAAAVASVLLG
ncbi:PCBP4, partial [Symbiodinium microadriaticum]